MYLKSGKFLLTRENIQSYIGFLFSQLDSAINSADEISLDNNFKIDILVSRHQKKIAFPKYSTAQFKRIPLNSYCKLIFGKFRNLKLDKAMSQSKCGFINFSSLCPGANCYMLSIAFGIFVTKLNCNFEIALNTFLSKHRFNYDIFIACQLYPLSVSQLQQMDLWKSVDLISCEKKINIEIFGETSEPPKIYMIYATNNNLPKRSPSIYINLKEDVNSKTSHIDYIFDLALLNADRKGKTCNFCKRHFSYSWFPIHKCKFDKCFLCMRYIKGNNFDWSSTLICDQNSNDSILKCKECKKVFKNRSCYDMHRKMVCQKYKVCTACKSFYTIGYEHKCNERFCRICFKSHGKGDIYCRYLNPRKKKTKYEETTLFADIHLNNKDNVPILIVANINNSTDLNGMLFCQNIACNIKDFALCIKGFSDCDSNSDIILKAAIHYLLFQTNVNKTLVIICKLDLYNLFKSYLISKGKKLTKVGNNSFAFNRLIFKIFQNFVDMNDIKMAYFLGKNPNLAVISPKFCITDASTYDYNAEDFLAENLVFGENVELFQAVQCGKQEVKELFDKRHINAIYLSLIIIKTLNAVLALSKACIAFDLIEKQSGLTNFNMFNFNTLTESGFSFLTKALDTSNVCILPNKSPSKYKNSSKVELIMCHLFETLHANICPSYMSTFSFVSNSGKQYKSGSLSLDWACVKCKIGIMIEGSYKTKCLFHPQEPKTFFGKSTQNLFNASQNNRIKLLQQSKSSINKIYTLNECCIQHYSPVFCKILEAVGPKNCNKKDIWKEFKKMFNNFELNKYELPHFQDCILPSMVTASCCYMKHNKNYQTMRFDMDSAYLYSLLHQPLPKGDPIPLIGQSAFVFFQKEILPKKMFSILSVTVLPPKNEIASYLPFLVYRNSNGSHLTLCRTCSIQNSLNNHCIHVDIERQFDVTCLLYDLLYALSIGYKIVNVNSLYYWPTVEIVHSFDTVLVNFIQSIANYKEDKLVKIFLKRMALQGLGRFAFNMENTWHEIQCYQPYHFQIELEKANNVYYQVNEQKATFKSRLTGLTHKQIYRHAVSAKINPIIFALASNITRIACHRKAIECLNSNALLCRVDSDCIMLTFPRTQFHIFFFKFKEKYKIEESDIIEYICLKPRNYQYMRSNSTICVKCNGLKMSIMARHDKQLLASIEEISVKDRKCFVECKKHDIHYIQTFAIGS